MLPGADPGFQVKGGYLKKLCRAQGGTKILCQKIIFFPIWGGGACQVCPPGSTPEYMIGWHTFLVYFLTVREEHTYTLNMTGIQQSLWSVKYLRLTGLEYDQQGGCLVLCLVPNVACVTFVTMTKMNIMKEINHKPTPFLKTKST